MQLGEQLKRKRAYAIIKPLHEHMLSKNMIAAIVSLLNHMSSVKNDGRCDMQPKYQKIKNLLVCLLVSSLYPIYKYVSSANDKLMHFINAATIVGLVMLILGVLYSLMLHGDFDITEYVAKRAMSKKQMKPYKAFKEDKKEEREGRINYPLFVGLILLAAAAILTLLNY